MGIPCISIYADAGDSYYAIIRDSTNSRDRILSGGCTHPLFISIHAVAKGICAFAVLILLFPLFPDILPPLLLRQFPLSEAAHG